jgi:hypothetical protein
LGLLFQLAGTEPFGTVAPAGDGTASGTVNMATMATAEPAIAIQVEVRFGRRRLGLTQLAGLPFVGR